MSSVSSPFISPEGLLTHWQGHRRVTRRVIDAFPDQRPKQEILRLWDESTATLDQLFPRIPHETFLTVQTAFGQWPGKLHDLILYVIDNENHHCGQGDVYLRALSIEPPPFYDRS